jgi:hypothetical protein
VLPLASPGHEGNDGPAFDEQRFNRLLPVACNLEVRSGRQGQLLIVPIFTSWSEQGQEHQTGDSDRRVRVLNSRQSLGAEREACCNRYRRCRNYLGTGGVTANLDIGRCDFLPPPVGRLLVISGTALVLRKQCIIDSLSVPRRD